MRNTVKKQKQANPPPPAPSTLKTSLSYKAALLPLSSAGPWTLPHDSQEKMPTEQMQILLGNKKVTFAKTGHVLGHQMHPNRFKRTETVWRVLRPQLGKRKIPKHAEMKVLNNSWIKEISRDWKVLWTKWKWKHNFLPFVACSQSSASRHMCGTEFVHWRRD